MRCCEITVQLRWCPIYVSTMSHCVSLLGWTLDVHKSWMGVSNVSSHFHPMWQTLLPCLGQTWDSKSMQMRALQNHPTFIQCEEFCSHAWDRHETQNQCRWEPCRIIPLSSNVRSFAPMLGTDMRHKIYADESLAESHHFHPMWGILLPCLGQTWDTKSMQMRALQNHPTFIQCEEFCSHAWDRHETENQCRWEPCRNIPLSSNVTNFAPMLGTDMRQKINADESLAETSHFHPMWQILLPCLGETWDSKSCRWELCRNIP